MISRIDYCMILPWIVEIDLKGSLKGELVAVLPRFETRT